MAADAVRCGRTIGVAATLPTTLGPATDLFRDEGLRRGRRHKIRTALLAKAFEAMRMGRVEEHDHIVAEGIETLMNECDTIVLAQASMARVLPQLCVPEGVAILTSPESGVRQMRRLLAPSTA